MMHGIVVAVGTLFTIMALATGHLLHAAVILGATINYGLVQQGHTLSCRIHRLERLCPHCRNPE